MKITKLLLGLTCLFVGNQTWAQTFPNPQETIKGLEKTTHEYIVKDGTSLKFDLYVDKSKVTDKPMPLFIYSFGGGWEGGCREDGAPVAFLAKQGIAVACIDYRLGYLEARKKGEVVDVILPKMSASNRLGENGVCPALEQAIKMGVEDLYDATSYFVENAAKFNIDPKCIIIGGSSAGSINSLTAEYWRANNSEIAVKHLPAGFKYAGLVVAGSGIWTSDSDGIQWKSNPCPIMWFHGDADNIVAYGKRAIEGTDLVMYGPKAILPQLAEKKSPYWLYTVKGADHCIEGLPFRICHWEIMSFINRLVFNQEQIAIESEETDLDEPRTLLWYYSKMLGVDQETIKKKIENL